MQNTVTITADDMGNVVRQSSTSTDYGFVRLVQQRVTFGNNNWVKNSNVSTLLLGKLDDLVALNLTANQELPGKIIIKEQLVPFNINDAERDLKYAGDTGIICSVNGQPIYRKTFFMSDVTAQDVLLSHTNGQDIKDLYDTGESKSAVPNATAEEAFEVKDEQPQEIVEDTVEEVVEEMVEETFDL
jgi:hypothetical protein